MGRDRTARDFSSNDYHGGKIIKSDYRGRRLHSCQNATLPPETKRIGTTSSCNNLSKAQAVKIVISSRSYGYSLWELRCGQSATAGRLIWLHVQL